MEMKKWKDGEQAKKNEEKNLRKWQEFEKNEKNRKNENFWMKTERGKEEG